MISVNQEFLVAFEKYNLLLANIEEQRFILLKIEQTIQKTNELGFTLAACVSKCGNYVCLSDDLKFLFLFARKDNTYALIRKTTLEKRCCKIQFSHDMSTILVADKSGYLLRIPIDFKEPEFNPKWISMGHVSVLTDFDLHPKQKLIATCDRDEKIRISHYPDCFEIYCYLLGHEKFVSQVLFTENGKNLISSGGDGFLISWDLKTKKEINRIPFCDNLSEVPMVTRMFTTNSRIFLFFHGLTYFKVFHLSENGIFGELHKIDMELVLCDAGIRNINVRTVEIQLLYSIDEQTRYLQLFSFDIESNIIQKKSNNMIEDFIFSADTITDRKIFLESLPKIPVDKTGLDIYHEKKQKRLKLDVNTE